MRDNAKINGDKIIKEICIFLCALKFHFTYLNVELLEKRGTSGKSETEWLLTVS